MELSGEVRIAAPRGRVWAALNDPDVLARCIDGVESLERSTATDGDQFSGRMNAKVGPVRATFAGQVRLADVVPETSYRLIGEGKGGVAGFAKGEAQVTLAEPAPGETLLAYQVTSSVGGKLAQLGARLIEGTAKAYAETFFTRLKAEVETVAPAEEPAAAPADAQAEPAPATAPPATGVPPWLWGGALVLAVLAFLAWQWQ